MANQKISALTGSSTPLAGTEVLPIVQSGSTKQVAVSDLTAGRTVAAKSLTLTGVAATGYTSFSAGGTTTNYNIGLISNTGGGLYFGVDNSGGTAIPGNTAYGAILVTSTATDLNLGTNATVNWRITNSTGNLTQVTANTGINFTANTPTAGMTSQLMNWYEEGNWTPNQGSGLTVVGTFTSSGTYVRVGRLVTLYGKIAGSTSIAVTAATIICTNLPFTSTKPGQGVSINNSNNITATNYVANTSKLFYSSTTIAATPLIEFNVSYFA